MSSHLIAAHVPLRCRLERIHSFLSRTHAYNVCFIEKKLLRDDISRDDPGNRVDRISVEFQRPVTGPIA